MQCYIVDTIVHACVHIYIVTDCKWQVVHNLTEMALLVYTSISLSAVLTIVSKRNRASQLEGCTINLIHGQIRAALIRSLNCYYYIYIYPNN